MKKTLFLALCALALISCNKDELAPTITIEEPANGATFSWDEIMPVSALFEDDVDLADYKVSLINKTGAAAASFNFKNEMDISGKSRTFSANILIPDSVNSAVLNFIVHDAEGNETSMSVALSFTP